jgi:hypothetical protein
MDDIFCLGLLQPLMRGPGFLPFSDTSLRPFCMVHILNDIVANDRKNILEFGSGLSTILIGRMIKRSALNARLISVEHNKIWVIVLNEIIQQEGIDVVEIIYAPLKKSNIAAAENYWYDTNVLNSKTAYKKFDMVIIDGPAASQKGSERARYPAVPYIFSKLNKEFSIYLDDANQVGEQSVLQTWEKEYGIEFTLTGGTLAYFKTLASLL